jgi:hypothetical protein
VGKTAWANFRPPEWVDGEAFLFCGADPAWTPAKEQRLATDPDGAPGKCRLCGGEGRVEIDGEEYLVRIAIERGDPNVCGRCGRYGRQHLIDTSPVITLLAPRQETPAAAADDKTARSKNDAGGRTPLPAAAAPPSSLVVVCHEHPDCVRRGDIHVPAKYAAMLAED